MSMFFVKNENFLLISSGVCTTSDRLIPETLMTGLSVILNSEFKSNPEFLLLLDKELKGIKILP